MFLMAQLKPVIFAIYVSIHIYFIPIKYLDYEYYEFIEETKNIRYIKSELVQHS